MRHTNDELAFSGTHYTLRFLLDRPFAELRDANGDSIAVLFTLSSVHALAGQDDTPLAGRWERCEDGDVTVFSLTASSSVWASKVYEFRCSPTRFTYSIVVNGRGVLTDVHYFGGYASAYLRWGSGYFQSGQSFETLFNPEPSSREQYHLSSAASTKIDMTGVPLPGRSDWFFTPAPFCYAAKTKLGWMGFGVEAQRGQNRFTEYRYHGGEGFSLCLSYEGYTQVNGSLRLPSVAVDFGDTEYDVLTAHANALRAQGFAPTRDGRIVPWWKEPIFCGWGAQCNLGRERQQPAPTLAVQKNYERFVVELENSGLKPGTLVIDDKWQREYGENQVDEDKWPDLPGFIARAHQKGQKVLLWLKAWDPEGIPADECIVNAGGVPVSVDPTNPNFEQRLRRAVRRMLGEDGYGADGFKIDFSARIPSGPGMHRYGGAWGLELMKQYLEILYSEAKAVKSDALVVAHTPHPYLADVIDMVRLNDINTGHEVSPQMRHRARVARAACPDALIDTDNWPMPSLGEWREYTTVQPTLGVPALYLTTHLDSTGEPLEPTDYELVRETWSKYRIALRGEAAT